MASEGIGGLYIETRSYGATGAFWRALGYEPVFETDHGSGQWVHPGGGPYLFVAERQDGELTTHPIVHVADAAAFAPGRELDWVHGFEPTHWDMLEGVVRDPDGREVSLQAPLPEGTQGIDADAHHADKYGA